MDGQAGFEIERGWSGPEVKKGALPPARSGPPHDVCARMNLESFHVLAAWSGPLPSRKDRVACEALAG